jgi:acyl-CoA dehydrogenase
VAVAIEFGLDREIVELRQRVRDFIDTEVISSETAQTGQHGPPDELRAKLQPAARAAGVFAPHVAAGYEDWASIPGARR